MWTQHGKIGRLDPIRLKPFFEEFLLFGNRRGSNVRPHVENPEEVADSGMLPNDHSVCFHPQSHISAHT